MRKRLTAALLCLCLLFTLLPATAFAEGEADSGTPPAGSALCEHHPQHDESCGYTEGTEGSPCTHEHDEDCYALVTECVHEHTAECYPAQSVSENTATPSQPEEAKPTACTHVCSEESGCITEVLDCKHEHDETCGYVPATEGTPCAFVCEVCNTQDSGDTATPSDAQPEECICETLCTEDNINEDCPVCGAEGADLNDCKGAAPAECTCETLCTGEEINADCPVCSVEGAELDKVCVGVAPMLPVTALAVEEHGSHNNGWTELTADTTTLSDGSYYLSGDVEYTGTESITVSGEVILCLNSQKLNLKGQHISVGSGASFTLCDCSTGGVLTGGSGGYRGSGGGVYVDGGGTFTMTSGNIAGNTAAAGGGVYVDDGGTFTMEGGSIYNNKATTGGGGGVMVHNGTFTLSGGSITGNATNSETYGYGGGVCLYGTFYLSGDAIIQGNTKAGTTDNLYLGWQTINITGPLGENAHIGVNAEAIPRSFINGWSDNMAGKNPADYFSSDDDTWDIGLNADGDVVLGSLCTIITQPTDKSVIEGKSATFTVNATGSEPLSYQWQQNMNGSGWTDITGETNATYTTGKTTMDMNGTQYRCVVSNSAGSVISDAATLAVQKSTTPIDPKYVRYIVEHYKQNADGRYTLADTEQPIDEIGKTVTATPKTYEGYTYNPNAAGTVAGGTLTEIRDAADIVTLKLYYDLTVYTVTVEIEGSGTAAASPASATAGTEIRLTADPGGNYHFERWEVVSGNITIENNAFSMPDENVTVRAVFARDASGGSSGTEGGHTGDDEADEEDSDSPSGNIGVQEEADSPFTDVLPGDWFYNDVMFAWENGLMDGTGAVTFSPNVPITRAQVALIFFRLAGSPEVTGDNPFTDVENSPATAWYYDAALWAHQRGIVAGYADHTWHPGDPVSREQLAVMFRNYANYRGYDLTAADNLSGYADAGEVSEWAKESVRWAADRGMMNGRNSAVLNPTGIVTRAQAAAMLCRFIESNSLVPPVVVSGENEDAEGMDSGERGWTQQFPGPMTGSMARNDYVPVVSDGADTERRALRASKKQAKI